MQRNVAQGVIASLTLLFVLVQTASAQDWKWFDSPDEAVSEAAQSGKLIIISVGADWCHYCKKMERETWSDVKLRRAIAQHYVPLKLTDEKHRELLAKLRIDVFPTTLVYTSDRKFLKKFEGFLDAEKLAFLLEQIRVADGQRPTQSPPIR